MKQFPEIEKLGKNIKQRREYLNMTQRKLAKLSGVTPAAISLIEKGKRIPNIRTFASIAGELKASMDELYYSTPIEWMSMTQYRKSMQDLEKNINKAIKEITPGGFIGEG
jgi:transcriptional regulator with XRE-family HTH domain